MVSPEFLVEILNGRIKARFAAVDGGIRQEYLARRGGKWVPVVESFRPPKPFPAGGNALYNSGIDPQHRLIVTEGLSSVRLLAEADGVRRVELSGQIGEHRVTQLASLADGDDFVHIEVQVELAGKPPKLEYLLSTFAFNVEAVPKFVHTPSLKDRVDDIVGDGVFYAPVVVLQEGPMVAALAPDLEMINACKVLSPDARRRRLWRGNPRFRLPFIDEFLTMPTGLDLNVRSGLTPRPVFSFGYIDSLLAHHVRFRHPNDGSMVRAVQKNVLRYGFDLFVRADAAASAGFQAISQHQWRRYGHKTLQQPRPQAMPFEAYARLVYANQFKPLGNYHPPVPGYKDTGSFLAFELDGWPVGGYRNAASFWLDVLCNGLWWNNMSDAVGFYYWGRKLGDPSLIDRARRTVNLAMLAPQSHGLFPVIYKAAEKRWVGNHFDPPLKQPTFEGMFQDAGGYVSPDYNKVSPNRFQTRKGWSSRSYLIAACSRTGVHLLEYYTRCERDERIVGYLRRYADYMLTQIDEKGTVPAWITYDLKPHWILRDSAHNAATMWFLAELCKVTKEKKYLDGAEKIAAFMLKEILPRMDFKDLEHYFSCGKKPLWYRQDKWQGLPTRGVLSQIWAMHGFKAMYEASGDPKYLKAGEKVVDYFAFYQTCWAPHFKYTAYTFGGCDTDNGDGAWLNGHQSQTVLPLIWYGLELGRQDLLERGVAGARASVVLVRSQRHIDNNIWPHPKNHPVDGLGPENVDHPGFASDCGRSSPGMGEGNGVNTGLATADRLLGGAFIHAKKSLAVGVDGVRIEDWKLDGRTLRIQIAGTMSKLERPWDKPYRTVLRVAGLDEGQYTLELNDSRHVTVTAEQLASLPLLVRPDGSVLADLKH
ncbi:MAG: beta-L-arabinofuranosidase domain-containing protein [Planctomycetota bacterium]